MEPRGPLLTAQLMNWLLVRKELLAELLRGLDPESWVVVLADPAQWGRVGLELSRTMHVVHGRRLSLGMVHHMAFSERLFGLAVDPAQKMPRSTLFRWALTLTTPATRGLVRVVVFAGQHPALSAQPYKALLAAANDNASQDRGSGLQPANDNADGSARDEDDGGLCQ